jgi:hypothetical protein
MEQTGEVPEPTRSSRDDSSKNTGNVIGWVYLRIYMMLLLPDFHFLPVATRLRSRTQMYQRRLRSTHGRFLRKWVPRRLMLEHSEDILSF